MVSTLLISHKLQMASSPLSVIDPLPITFARELRSTHGRMFIRPATRLYIEARGEFAIEAQKRLAMGEMQIALDAELYELNLIDNLRYEQSKAALVLCRLGDAK